MEKTRADFSEPTKRVIAERSSYKCSFPDCNITTLGPSENPNKSEKTGIAAHIYAAAEGGPRGTGGLSFEERRSPDNGIWLCCDHAKLIDNNNGAGFPAETLRSYKALREARTMHEQRGISTPFGWLHKINIRNSPLFSTKTEIKLSKLNYIVGNNGVGKSAICEWIAGLKDCTYFDRWWGASIDYSLEIYTPQMAKVRATLDPNNNLDYWIGRESYPFNPIPISIIYPKPLRLKPDSDLEELSRIIGYPPKIIINLIDEIHRYDKALVTNLRFEKDEDGIERLHADVEGTVPGLPMRLLSGGELQMVIVEFVTAAARVCSSQAPTLVILDGSIYPSDEIWFEAYSAHFNDRDYPFQTIMTVPTREFSMDKIIWQGWEVIRLEGEFGAIEVSQSIR